MTIEARTASERATHWDAVYDTKGEDGVSWYQSVPAVTPELLEVLGTRPDAAVVDVGGGASVVVDHLVAQGFTDVSVLDVSKVALDNARRRLGPSADLVRWLHRDIFDWTPERQFELWHDRAVLHFLVDEAERDAYLQVLLKGLGTSGAAIIATFDLDGPSHCSALPVVRYDALGLAELFAPHLELVASRREEHLTPAGKVQPFTWVAMRRVA